MRTARARFPSLTRSCYKILALLFLLSFLFFGAAIVDAYFVDWLGYEFERLLRPPLQS